MTHPIERAFLDDIIRDPYDDFPRLAYADWMEDHGQEERAAWVRDQVNRPAGVVMRSYLRDAPRSSWTPPVGSGLELPEPGEDMRLVVWRGWVDEVSIPWYHIGDDALGLFDPFMDYLREWCSLQPIMAFVVPAVEAGALGVDANGSYIYRRLVPPLVYGRLEGLEVRHGHVHRAVQYPSRNTAIADLRRAWANAVRPYLGLPLIPANPVRRQLLIA